MRAHVQKLNRRLKNEPAFDFVKDEETSVENLQKLFENVSLRSVSLEERRREASKPLYLVRYE